MMKKWILFYEWNINYDNSAVADAVRTSLGPRGMDKMIQTGNGEVTITNDGATILKQMSVIHQASKMVWRKRFFFKKN